MKSRWKPRQQATEQQIEAAIWAILGLTHGGRENALKVIGRVPNDGEAARLIATASWGSMGGSTFRGGYVEGRNQVITVQLGEVKLTLTPSQWVQRVRHMFARENNLQDSIQADLPLSAELTEPTPGTR